MYEQLRVWIFFSECKLCSQFAISCVPAQCRNRKGKQEIPLGWKEGSSFNPQDTSFSNSDCGAQNIPPDVKTPLGVYKLIIDEELVAHLLQESNQYAKDNKVQLES